MKYYIQVFLIMFCIVSSNSQNYDQSFYQQTDFLLTSPGAMKFGLYGYDNPALLSYLHQPDMSFMWSDQGKKWNDFNRWGLFTAIPNIGFGLVHQKKEGLKITDYRFSLAGGNRNVSFGASYGWSNGDKDYFNHSNSITIGSLIRPIKYVSFGVVGSIATQNEWNEGVIDLAVRPLGSPIVTLFIDGSLQHGNNLKHANWSVGTAIEALPGIRLTSRYFDNKTFTIGFQLSFGHLGIVTQSYYDKESKHTSQAYGIRIGAYDRTIIGTKVITEKKYVEFNLNGQIKYQKYRLFDKSNTLISLLTSIKAAKDDPSVNGIAINTSGMAVNREMLWEIREQLRDFKSTGKHVVIFIDRPNIDVYHFASIADKIVMDPTGMITLEGYITGRTYLRGTLDKLGIGFNEWRFFKYKSALETFSRDRMSDADREQRQKLVDDYYKLAKSDICSSRNISTEQFDILVNDETFFLPSNALDQGLVDTLGRWETVSEVIKKLEGDSKSYINAGNLAKFKSPYDNHWGEKPRIAVIYALGACAMDEGITARKLVKDVEAVTNDTKVKAVVLRVDSPGGDAMASDYIAEALKKCKEKKPVIVSQGYVAASGGYWLSMYADKIVAAPNTITGSIGVIGGWAYNKGLKDTLGMSTDHVKVGKHADLGFGFTMPLINVSLPDRDLTEAERTKMEYEIRTFYREFVTKVASGRNKKFEEIEEIAQGRVWSGYDGKDIGLVDILGGLEDAIMIAKEIAGICPKMDVEIVEYPTPGLFDMSIFIPKLILFNVEDDPIIQHIKFRLTHNGEPLPLMPIDEMDVLSFK